MEKRVKCSFVCMLKIYPKALKNVLKHSLSVSEHFSYVLIHNKQTYDYKLAAKNE
ncbi:hypothetical protein J2Z60_001474 [Lactobacillus colini]|uniref:Uncharacterized protein n=1 Tax=Lactobacillus colini TaxID=1819254 RepID=A0ABS4MF25_9LACO|nr:hypothetical protein [Lactobacillus colini]